MIWSLFLAGFVILVVVLKYAWPRRERCPECDAVRQDGQPLCPECGWIYEVPGEEDEDYADGEEEPSAR